jgi:ATP-dependent protease Clp ATPase subunit
MTTGRLTYCVSKLLGLTHRRSGPMRSKRHIYICSFCDKRQDQVQRLIAGPKNVYVCNECVAVYSKEPEEPHRERGLSCSFCGKKQGQVQYLIVGPHEVNICNQCLILCQEIIAEEPEQNMLST